MGKVFSRPEKAVIYRRRIIFEMESLGVNSIPTLIYYEQGREKDRLVGYHEKAEILRHFGLDG